MSVSYEVDGGVATITLASPETRNVLTASTMTLLHDYLGDAAVDDGVRVIVLTGEGSTFCAGADLAGAAAADADPDAASFASTGPAALVAVLEAMLDHPKPIIARVQGHVAGGGNGLVAAADISVAAESARFAFSEVRVGVAPAVISVVCLARMRATDARELLLTGERVSAERVREAGLVTSDRRGQWIFYRIAPGVAERLAGIARTLVPGGLMTVSDLAATRSSAARPSA